MAESIEKYLGCLSHLAFSSESSLGREYQLIGTEVYLDQLDPFLRDQVTILESKSLRRLGFKTQVFADLTNPHIRHRSDHTREVEAAAVWIATLTGLNSSLSRAIALGHDLGHAPYGHFGERTISEITGQEFKHNIFGVVVAQKIEKNGKGLNLVYETLLGIRWHSGLLEGPLELRSSLPLECQAVALADKLSYLFADVNDIKRMEFPNCEAVEKKADFFGQSQRKRMQTCLMALVKESAEEGTLSFAKSEAALAFAEFKRWMYQEVYGYYDELRLNLRSALYDSYNFLSRFPYFADCQPAILLALMTDREVDELVHIIRNRPNPKIEMIAHLGIMEIAPSLKGKDIDFTKANLNPANFRKYIC